MKKIKFLLFMFSFLIISLISFNGVYAIEEETKIESFTFSFDALGYVTNYQELDTFILEFGVFEAEELYLAVINSTFFIDNVEAGILVSSYPLAYTPSTSPFGHSLIVGVVYDAFVVESFINLTTGEVFNQSDDLLNENHLIRIDLVVPVIVIEFEHIFKELVDYIYFLIANTLESNFDITLHNIQMGFGEVTWFTFQLDNFLYMFIALWVYFIIIKFIYEVFKWLFKVFNGMF